MANTKISQLTALTNPTWNEEFVYALNNANGKVTLDTMKTFIGSWWGGGSYTAWTWIDITSDVISNTWVLSLNSITWAVHLKTINWNNIVWAWDIDTTSTYTEYNYSALQWPAASWYHVPTSSEWWDVYDMMVSLWISTSNWDFSKLLKIPLAWYILNSTWNINAQWTSAQLYTVTAIASSDDSYSFAISMSSVAKANVIHRAMWASIRAFKDSAVVPEASWTTLFDWSLIATWAWIFWDSNNWYISISSNWEDWITIADKNVWATTVWNYWDSLSNNNCWSMFQWWNNYWFPAVSWTYTKSTTQVNASSYWPWNYYSSSTLIYQQFGWDSSQNWDLWWWVTWPTATQYDIYNRFQLSWTNITIWWKCVWWLAWDILSWSYTLVTWNNFHIWREHYLYIPTQTNSYSITAWTWVSNPFNVTLPSSIKKACLIKFYCDSVSTMIITDCLIAN